LAWDDKENFDIPDDLIKGIKEELCWDGPSRIQSVAIPMFVKISEESKDFDNLIAQAKNGAGKTGAFVIGSLLRVDSSIDKLQVIVIGHTRELVNQTSEVYVKATKYAPAYRICNLMQD
jgi:superfamily II DNA/RNA helicase